MTAFPYSFEQLSTIARFSDRDLREINKRRQTHNQLGYGYQLAFVRLLNRFPIQSPIETIAEILAFVSLQLNIADTAMMLYGKRRKTVSEHQEDIRSYLHLRSFGSAISEVEATAFKLAYNLEQSSALRAKLRDFLRD